MRARTSAGRKYLALTRTTVLPASSPSATTPVSVRPGLPSQRIGMPARANALSAKSLHLRAKHTSQPKLNALNMRPDSLELPDQGDLPHHFW